MHVYVNYPLSLLHQCTLFWHQAKLWENNWHCTFITIAVIRNYSLLTLKHERSGKTEHEDARIHNSWQATPPLRCPLLTPGQEGFKY